MSSNGKYILYGTDHSYYTGKIRPYLRYKGIPYQERLATLLVYSRFIIPRTGVRFIPVIHTPDNLVIQDTSDIIDCLEMRFPYRSVYPDSPKQKIVALLFELYADEWFTLPAMHYRWSYLAQQENYIMEEFGNVAGAFLPRTLKRLVGRQVSRPFKGALKPLGINRDTIPAIEQWYEQFLANFNRHLERYPFLLGSRPCIGDFALAGPLYAHMLKDPVPGEQMRRVAPLVVDWIERINAYPQAEGAFLEDDTVPETLAPMLKHLFKELWPLLEDTAKRLPEWLQRHPNKSTISRVIGEHQLSVGDSKAARLVYPYSQWMMQRPLNHYNSLTVADRQKVDDFLKTVDGYESFQFQIPQQVKRRNNKLLAA